MIRSQAQDRAPPSIRVAGVGPPPAVCDPRFQQPQARRKVGQCREGLLERQTGKSLLSPEILFARWVDRCYRLAGADGLENAVGPIVKKVCASRPEFL